MGHSVFERARVPDASGGFQNLQPYDVTILVIVENHARLILVTLFDRRVAEDNGEYIDFRVIGYLHASLQRFSTGASYHQSCTAIRILDYFPTQNFEKMTPSTSSTVVAPVRVSSAWSAS